MERDNDTFKNLRTIPVTSTQMVLAKIFVLFLFGIIFCVASTIATILCGLGTLEVYGLGYKLFLAVETGIFIPCAAISPALQNVVNGVGRNHNIVFGSASNNAVALIFNTL